LPGWLRRTVWFPDDQAGWLPFAVAALVLAGQRRAIDAVLSSSSPVTAHVVAMVAAGILGVPWIADFRDPWLDNPIEPVGRLDRWRRATLERAVVRSAARTTFATPSLRATYARRYPHLAHRFSTLPNGYEPVEPPSGPPPIRGQRPFRLVYAGSLYRPAELDTFLAGLERFAIERPDLAAGLRMTFVGHLRADCRAIADRWSAHPRLAPLVEFTGFVPRAEAQAAVAGAHACLTLLGAGPGMEMFVGAKLYDYLAMDRQVLAVVPPGDVRTILADLGWGVIADPEPEAIAAALARLVESPLPSRRADPDGRYRRAAIVARLGALLDEVTGHGAAHPPTSIEDIDRAGAR
jgi:glycosyltransferase involved in cell wall biosynthesis